MLPNNECPSVDSLLLKAYSCITRAVAVCTFREAVPRPNCGM